VGPTVVVEADPFSDDARGVFLSIEAVTMHTLLFQSPDNALDHAVLLWAVRGDELLSKPITAHETRVGPRGEDEAVIRPQQERRSNAAECPEPRDQRLLERRHRRRCSTDSRELPAKQLSRVTVDDEGQGSPAITTRPDAAEIRRPALIGCRRSRGQRLDTKFAPRAVD